MPPLADVQHSAWTDAQREAVESTGASVAVVAGAGSGKTRLLIGRLLAALNGEWSSLDRVLAITFTEKAAAELRARLRPHLPPRHRHRLESAWIGTFHASCARILRQHAPLVGLDPSFAILDENAGGLLARAALHRGLLSLLALRDADASALVDGLDFRTAMGALSELMQYRWHARAALAERVADEEEQALLASMEKVWSRIEAAWREELLLMNALDFQELEIRALELLDRRPEILASYRRRFRHILVDEYQDTSDAQTELVLKLFSPRENRLLIVGDPRQSIYRFRGANLGCFATALGAIRKARGRTIHLAQNFRSRAGIVAFVNACQDSFAEELFEGLGDDAISPAKTVSQFDKGCHPDESRDPVPQHHQPFLDSGLRQNDPKNQLQHDLTSEGMIATREDEGGRPSFLCLPVEAGEEARAGQRRLAEAKAIAAFISRLVEEGRAGPPEIVLLFRALTSVEIYQGALRRAAIPCRIFGGRGFLERQEIVDLVAVLQWASNPRDHVALLTLLRSPLVGLSDDDLVLLAGPKGKDLLRAVMGDPRCRLLARIAAMAGHRRPSEILREVLDITGYELCASGLDPSGGAAANIERLLDLTASIERQEPTTLADLSAYLQELKAESARLGDPPAAGGAGDAVRCMTVHAAKGLEFPVVILPDLFRTPQHATGNWRFLRGRGIAFKIKDPDRPFGERRESERFQLFREEEARAAEAESMRLLYVAMTRAQELLLLPIHPGMKKDGPWHRWLAPLAKRHGVAKIPQDSSLPERPRGPEIKEHAPLAAASRAKASQRAIPGKATARLTVSQIESFDRCPQEYYLKYVLRLPSSRLLAEPAKTLPANVAGSIVHGVLRRSASKNAIPTPDTDIPGQALVGIQKTSKTLDSDWSLPRNMDELTLLEFAAQRVIPEPAAIAEVRRFVRAALEIPIGRRSAEGAREVPFLWSLEGRTIAGSIDWLLPADGGFEIVDFKTDGVGPSEVARRAAAYELQLVCYALAAEAGTGEGILATSLLFLSPGEIVREAMDASRRERGLARILAILKGIEREAFSPKENPSCLTCPYRHNDLCWGQASTC